MKSKSLTLLFSFLLLLFFTMNLNAQFGSLKNKIKKAKINTSKSTKKGSEKDTNVKESTSAGRIWYVSKSKGKNKNPGTKDSPLKNIDKAIKKSKIGDEIYIANGKYMGTFKIGYLESDKPLRLYGSWDDNFSKQDVYNHPTVFQPDNASGGKSRKAMLRFTN